MKRVWPKGQRPFPFQLKAVDFVRPWSRRAYYLAIDAGLGKTVIAALITLWRNTLRPTRAFYICPPFLLPNTDAEFTAWGAHQYLTMIPSTSLVRSEARATVLKDLHTWLKTPGNRAILFVDEAHFFMNDKTGRTIGMLAVAKAFKRVVFLSGTPMPNSRPIELWTILKHFAPDTFGESFFPYFARRFCGAEKTHFGWDFDGFTNRDEFMSRLTKSFMLRLTKADSGLKLPPKVETMLTVGPGVPTLVSNLERKLIQKFTKEDLYEGSFTEQLGRHPYFTEYLRLIGELKVKFILPYIQNVLTDTKDALLIFAHHKSVIEELTRLLTNYNPCVIAGNVPSRKRQSLVDEFQRDPSRRVFIGNILAAGIGLTLTKASRVLIVEPSWRDGDNSQAADRAHRIGQTQTVIVQYVVVRDSLEGKRMETLLRKRRLAV